MEWLGVILGTSGVTALVQFLINRYDKKKTALDKIETKLSQLDLATCRTQLLLLMGYYPENRTEILTVAQRYFEELKGDWYLSSIFNQWLDCHNMPKPLWFNK